MSKPVTLAELHPAPILIRLSWPPSALNPNARGHWTRRIRATKGYREACALDAMAQGLRRINADALHVTITLCPPNNNRRDVQNTIAALKAAVDGVADVLGVDDSRWRIVWPVAFSGPVRGGCVLVEIAADQMVTA